MGSISAWIPELNRRQRLWLRYLIADLEGDSDRMRRAGHALDAVLSRQPD